MWNASIMTRSTPMPLPVSAFPCTHFGYFVYGVRKDQGSFLPHRGIQPVCTSYRKHPPFSVAGLAPLSNTMSLYLNSSFCSTSADVFPEANIPSGPYCQPHLCLFGVHVPWHFRCPMNCWMNASVFKSRNYHFNCVDKNTEEVPGMIKQLQVTDFFSRKDTHTPHRAGCLPILDSPHVTPQQELGGPGSWHITPWDYGFLYVAHLVVFFQQEVIKLTCSLQNS